MRRLAPIIPLTTLLFAFSLLVQAQLESDPVGIAASSFTPSPHETVFIEANTPTLDRSSLFFEWFVNDELRPELSGLGKTSFSLRAGKVGDVTRLRLVVRRQNGVIGTASAIIQVADLVLPWFAETSVPPWYKGKALPIPKSVARVVAVPNFIIDGKYVPPENLVYRWSFNEKRRALEGLGEMGFRIQLSDLPGRMHQVSVTVEDSEKQISKTQELFLTASLPQVRIYQVEPLSGIRSSEGGQILFLGTKRGLFDFVAETFFFPLRALHTLSYSWNIDGSEILGETRKNLTLASGEDPARLVSLITTVTPRDPTFLSAIGIKNILFR